MANNTPKKLVLDLENNSTELVDMNSSEQSQYNLVSQELETVINSYKTKIIQKEYAIAKLVALGLTEQDIRAVIE